MSNPNAVACISVSAALGGSEWCLYDFATRAKANGVDAIVLVPKDGPLKEQLDKAGVRTGIAAASASLLGLSQRGTLSLADGLALATGLATWSRAIAKESERLLGKKPVVLYTNGFKAHLACALILGTKHVWHLHEFPPQKTRSIWRLLVGAVPTRTIANSRAVADEWTMAGFSPPDVAINGVDLTKFAPTPKTYWLHDQLALSHDVRLIGMPAIFARWKGHIGVVEAFERAAAQLDDVHLVLAGGAIYDTSAEKGFAEELVRRVGRSSLGGAGSAPKLNDRIHFVKHTPEPWKLYPEFDVTVHFSTRPEPFGRVLAESLASGVPVIAAKAGGPLEIVDEGVTGWLVPTGDSKALSDAMVRALTGDQTAMRIACRKAAEAKFSADRFASDVARVLLEAAAPPPGK